MNDTLEELVPQAQAGNKEAINILAKKFKNFIYSNALKLVRNYTEAETITQDVVIQAYISIQQLKCPKAYLSWVKKMTYHESMKTINQRQHYAEIIDCATPTSNNHDQEDLHKAIARLSPTHQKTLIGFYFQKKSIKQLAGEHEVPIGTIKQRLHNARCRLREHLLEIMKAN